MKKRSPWVLVLCLASLLPVAVALAQDSAQQQPQPTQPAAPSATRVTSGDPAAPKACSRNLLTEYDPNKGDMFGHDVSVWQLEETGPVIFQSGMTIDADGAPNAYNPDNTGLDDLSNAGEPGHWDGIVADRDGNPFVQGPNDPFPGFYVSQTALVDWSKERTDPARYVDASKIPYIVLPGELSRQFGARLGDFAIVMNLRNGSYADAIFGDIGTLGEGSVALANKLGIWADARNGGTRGGILYLVYPGSGNRQPRSLDDINSETNKLFTNWGGVDKLTSCAGAETVGRNQLAVRNFH